jgi:hypothetical protein
VAGLAVVGLQETELDGVLLAGVDVRLEPEDRAAPEMELNVRVRVDGRVDGEVGEA